MACTTFTWVHNTLCNAQRGFLDVRIKYKMCKRRKRESINVCIQVIALFLSNTHACIPTVDQTCSKLAYYSTVTKCVYITWDSIVWSVELELCNNCDPVLFFPIVVFMAHPKSQQISEFQWLWYKKILMQVAEKKHNRNVPFALTNSMEVHGGTGVMGFEGKNAVKCALCTKKKTSLNTYIWPTV